MIGKWHVIQEIVFVLGIKSRPAAIDILHADNPFLCSCDGVAVPFWITPMHGHGDNSSIVYVGVVVVFILKGPATGSKRFTFLGPIADGV